METISYINLTNGIEAITKYKLRDWRAIRIQSTACEQKLWADILNNLSDDFLISIAVGRKVVVYDFGARKEKPRAIWQGLEWIKFVLHKRWAGITYHPIGRAKSMGNYFEEVYSGLDKRTKARLDYFGKYFCGSINIHSVTTSTDKDSNYDFYRISLISAVKD